MLAPGHGGQSFWGRSNSPRRRRPCTSSISTTTLISGAFTICRYITQSYLCRKARLNPLRRLWQAPGEAFERLIVDCADDLNFFDYSDLLFRALRPALGLKHANTVKFMVGKVNLAAFLSELFVTWCELLLSRASGQSVQSGLSPIMPTTTLATGTVHQTHIGLELGVTVVH